MAADRLHRLIRFLTGSRDLGIHQRGFSNLGAVARAERGMLHALDHERSDLLGVPHRGGKVEGGSVRFLLYNDGAATDRGASGLSGDEGFVAGENGRASGAWLTLVS